MTLVLTWIDRDCTLHVADRRICLDHGRGRIVVRDDATPKIFVACGSLLVSFSGVAELTARRPITEWLDARLSTLAVADRELRDALGDIAADLDGEVGREFPGHRLTITISGWSLSDDNVLVPVVGTVTNVHPETGALEAQFKAAAMELPTSGGWVATGAVIPNEIRTRMQRQLRKGLQRGISVYVVAQVFLDALRQTAARNEYVGPTALVAVLPRVALAVAQTTGSIFLAEGRNGELGVGMSMVTDVPAECRRLNILRPML
jgi:hypothetical protein